MTDHEELPMANVPPAPGPPPPAPPPAPQMAPPPAPQMAPPSAPTAPTGGPWAPPATEEASPDLPPVTEGSTGRRHLVLPIVAGVVLVLGIGVAIAGLVAKANAEQDADDAALELVTVTEERDDALDERNTAVGEAATESAELATVTTEGERVLSIATGAATIADGFEVCDQRLRDTMGEAVAAVEAQDYARAERAGQAMESAVNDCNATTDAYDAAITSFYTDAGSGAASA